MTDNKNKRILNIILMLFLGVVSVLFTILSLASFKSGFLFQYRYFFITIFILCIAITLILCVYSFLCKKETFYKICLAILMLFTLLAIGYYLIVITGIFDKIRSVEELRKWVSSFGAWMPIIYVIINFLQVVILPIPGVVSVATGVALFGPNLAILYSYIGILLGSITDYFLGKKFGYKVVYWLLGKETVDKWLLAVKNKDRIVLTFMFFLPLFPDDVLCFVAGLSSMNTKYFIIMVTIARLITIAATSYSINGNLIPYNTWWGVAIWILIVIITIFTTIFLYKYGDKVEKKVLKYLKDKFKRKSNESKNNFTR